MSVAAHHALLDEPRVRPRLQHVEIVVRFKHQAMATQRVLLDKLRNVTQIRNHSDLDTFSRECKGNWIDSIVGDGKRSDLKIADGEFFARGKGLECPEARIPLNDFPRWASDVNGRLEGQRQRLEAFDVVHVLVGNNQGVEAVDRLPGGGQAAKCFFLAEACVHQQARALRRHQRAIALASAPQHTDSDAQPTSPQPNRSKQAPGAGSSKALRNYMSAWLARKSK